MMARVSQDLKERPLHDLVEGVFREQKHDIYLYTRGHLNHDHLWKPPDQTTHSRWDSSGKDAPLLLKPSRIPTPTRDGAREKEVIDAMCNFSIGTRGSVYVQPKQPKHAVPLPHRTAKTSHQSPIERIDDSNGRGLGSGVNPQRPNTQEGYVADSACIEELRLPELMLPIPSKKSPRQSREGRRRSSEGAIRESQQFVPSHLAGITKRDQYNQFRHFQDDVLRKSDAMEKNVLTGRKAVEHLEEKLYAEFMKLDVTKRQGGPNFHKLQIYSNIWQDLNEETPTFSRILSQIKAQYDRYLGSLLDTQPHRHSELLGRQVQSLTDSGLVLPGEMHVGQERVQHLEREATRELEENERLRESVRHEEELAANQPLGQDARRSLKQLTRKEDAPRTLSEQVLHLHTDILTKLDEIAAIRGDLRASFVPSSVCHHLEQNIRDTEADILKLLSTNEYLAKTIQQVENEVDRVFEKQDVSESDIRLIWKSINTLSSGLPDQGD